LNPVARTITAVHVTHEAAQKVGGIGAVLEGLLTTPAYRREVGRTLLVGPLFDNFTGAAGALGPGGRVLYSSPDNIDEGNWGARLRPVAEKFGAGIVYGKRSLRDEWSGHTAEVELLLVDIANMYRGPVDEFKGQLHEKFGLRSDRYEYIWDYEQYVRLALPGFEALERLVDLSGESRAVVIAHEYMGVPMALRALLAGNPRISTVFHAHEVATVRRIVEEHPAHDTMFYNVMPAARAEGLSLSDLFGSHDDFFKHGLIVAAHHCDSVFAVGEFVRQELQFLSESFRRREIDLVPNGIPAMPATTEEQERSRHLLCDYAEALLGWRPTFVFSHVARLVMSKAFWRDVHVLRHLDRRLAERGETPARRTSCPPYLRYFGRRAGTPAGGAVFYLLGTEGAQRGTEDVLRMESDYGWPWNHRVGYPDLTGPEIGLDRFLQDFNRQSRAVKIVFVNQFGWQPSRCGKRMPKEMTFIDLRRGSDVEFGQSMYEPFGISPLEPLTFGAVCVPTNVCGCVPFALQQSGGSLPDSLLVADYVSPAGRAVPARSLVEMSQGEADRVLDAASRDIADRVLGLLTCPPYLRYFGRRAGLREGREKPARRTSCPPYLRYFGRRAGTSAGGYVHDGHELASRMSWEVIAEDFFLPALRRSLQRAAARQGADASPS
jgi:hypothetical protein